MISLVTMTRTPTSPFCNAGLVSGVPMRDMQIATRHADPRTTGLYDMAKNNKDRHASHRVASFLAGMTG